MMKVKRIPTWVWALVILGGLAGAYVYLKRRQPTQEDAAADANSPTPGGSRSTIGNLTGLDEDLAIAMGLRPPHGAGGGPAGAGGGGGGGDAGSSGVAAFAGSDTSQDVGGGSFTQQLVGGGAITSASTVAAGASTVQAAQAAQLEVTSV